MGGIQLAKRGNGYMVTKEKTCKFPGCNNKFVGVGSRKFCDEHKDPKLRATKIDNSAKKAEKIRLAADWDLSNQIIKHNFLEGTETIQTCPCGKKFKVILFPNQYVYPKYCEEHRNPYRRKLLNDKLEKNGD